MQQHNTDDVTLRAMDITTGETDGVVVGDRSGGVYDGNIDPFLSAAADGTFAL